MRRLQHKKVLLLIASLVALGGLLLRVTKPAPVDFSADVKPILNKKCISCHGGVKKQGGFSLLFREEALVKTKSGKWGIVPGSASKSEMIRRLHLTDPEERMPYKHPPLSKEEIATLTRWIDEGAKWGEHWAYVAVKDVPAPAMAKKSFFGFGEEKTAPWGVNAIDAFTWAKMQAHGLKPAPEADPATLLRRVSLDLTGLPATPSLAQTFLKAHTPQAYERLVDSLLASPRFGERWASVWLDLARYADTKGYERDDSRNIWRYRDWVIDAFNKDMPYDRFLTEQLAGDLLEKPTDAQLIATAFHRNTMTNDEGGTDNEEFRTAAVIDRVNATWEGLMGTTFSCVQCHSHPYDPFRHEEYYNFLAFFNNTRDEDTQADYPLLRHFNAADSTEIEGISHWFKKAGFEKTAIEAKNFLKTWQPAYNSLRTDSFTNAELSDTKWLAMRNGGQARLSGVDLSGANQLIFRYQGYVPLANFTIHLDSRNGPVLKTISLQATKGWGFEKVALPEAAGKHDLYFAYSSPHLKNPDQSGVLFDWFYFAQTLPGKDKPGFDSIEKSYWQLLTKDVEGTPIMQENPVAMQRISHLFERGNWLTHGKEVKPATPASLNPFPNNAPKNRLGLAHWMTDKQNPLTARTIVNRLWEQLWGTGLVETLEDLGTQSAEPSHPELLDHLAYQMMHEWNWSLKKLLRQMVLSATYRQDSKFIAESESIDPANRWLARGPRYRLSAEQLRDQALFAAGILSTKMGGPGVMPWQPDGIWLSPWNGATWQASKNDDAYRRAIYTYWKRTAPYPSAITFDGVGREVCVARRIRTNTPLQALTTLNDTAYLQAADALAQRVQKSPGSIAEQISAAYETIFYKPIAPAKSAALEKLYQRALQQFQSSPDNLKTFMAGRSGGASAAAMMVVTGALLNLDEVLTKS